MSFKTDSLTLHWSLKKGFTVWWKLYITLFHFVFYAGLWLFNYFPFSLIISIYMYTINVYVYIVLWVTVIAFTSILCIGAMFTLASNVKFFFPLSLVYMFKLQKVLYHIALLMLHFLSWKYLFITCMLFACLCFSLVSSALMTQPTWSQRRTPLGAEAAATQCGWRKWRRSTKETPSSPSWRSVLTSTTTSSS